MGVFSRIVAGVDGTDWGFEALRQALVVASDTADLRAVTALDTATAVRTGIHADRFSELLRQEAAVARATAEEIIGGRPRADARVARDKPVDVLRGQMGRSRPELGRSRARAGSCRAVTYG